ncbi:MAG: hypothetical protein ACPF9D_05695, partial [Owenweeksia sp.]
NMASMGMEGDVDAKTASFQSVYGGCATLSYDSTGTTHELTINFGTTNCEGKDGKLRRGILVVTFEKQPFDAGSVHTVTANNYAVNNWVINGSRTVTYQGLNASSQPYSDLSVTLTIKRPDERTITWNSTRQRIWTEGFGDFNPLNNVVEITGSANGTTAKGINFNAAITESLRVESTCSNIVAGTLEISGPAFSTRTIRYGDGKCDRVAQLTVNGQTSTVLLR